MTSYKTSSLLLKVTVVTTGITVLGFVTVSIFYAASMSNIRRQLPDTMEGKATLKASLGAAAGCVDVYHIKVDFNKKLVQFSLSENTTTDIMATKIVVHDYNAVRKAIAQTTFDWLQVLFILS